MSSDVSNSVSDITAVFRELKKSCSGLGNESARLFHGRGKSYPGWSFLNIDYFSPVILITAYASCEKEILEQLIAFLLDNIQTSQIEAIVLQERFKDGSPFEVLHGSVPEEIYAVEGGLKFQLDLSSSQNIGFFLDMKNGREWITRHCQNKNVLNLFSYTCSFSVFAQRAGAYSIVNIDLSKRSLDVGKKNHEINGLPPRGVSFLDHNIFRSWKKLHKLGRYDVVIIDPPSRQKGSFDAEKDYKKLLKQMPKLLNDKAQILACLNSPYLGEYFLEKLVEEHLPRARKVERLPVVDSFPETDFNANLKAIHYTYYA